MSSVLSMVGTVARWSKEDTNDNHLNNLRLALQRADEPSAFAEKSAKLERMFDVASSLSSHKHETRGMMHK